MSYRSVMILLVCVSAALRVVAAANDLWFDEVWSWSHSLEVQGVSDVFKIYHDNNHPLNTLWMWFVGQDAPSWAYRAPTVVSGVLFVIVAALWAVERQASLWVCGLTAVSFPLVQYSTEARGYGFAMLFALTAWLTLRRLEFPDFDKRSRSAKILLPACYVVSCVLGLLSHATFVFPLIAFWIYSLSVIVVRRHPGLALIRSSCVQLPTLVAVAVYYWLFLRHLELGGGDSAMILPVLCSAASLFLGGPHAGLLSYLLAAVGGVVFLCALWKQCEKSPHDVIFYLALIFVPLVWCLVQRPNPIYERYFLLPIAFSLLLAGRQVAFWFEVGGKARVAGVFLTLTFLTCNLSAVVGVIATGRGSFSQLLLDAAQNTASSKIRIGSDHDFRCTMMLKYFQRNLPAGKTVHYYRDDEWPAAGPDWVILHDTSNDSFPPAVIEFLPGVHYPRMSRYSHSGLSGMSWGIYRNPTVQTQRSE